MRNGKGTFTYDNGDIYEGDYKDNMKNGKGTYTYYNGDIYEGDYKDGMMNGKGTFTYANRNIYEGDFKNGMMNGMGKFTYIDGNVYEGMFKDNMIQIYIKDPEPYNNNLEEYEIILFISSHGCDIMNDFLTIHLPKQFNKIINPIYVGTTDYKCINMAIPDLDLNYASLLFNKESLDKLNEQIEHYQLIKRKKIKYGYPNYNHKFQFGMKSATTLNEYDGIFIIKNNIGLPNNINLFNWNNPIYVNNDKTIKSISKGIVRELFKEADYNTLALSAILKSFYDWISNKSDITNKKLKLVLIDNSCRVTCFNSNIK